MIEPAGAAQQFKIVELFVRWDFAGLGYGHGLCEEKAAAVARVADALRDARAPREPGGIESVLQQECHVELLRAQFTRQMLPTGKASVRSMNIVGDELVADLLVAINVCDVGSGDDRDMGVRKSRADSS